MNTVTHRTVFFRMLRAGVQWYFEYIVALAASIAFASASFEMGAILIEGADLKPLFREFLVAVLACVLWGYDRKLRELQKKSR